MNDPAWIGTVLSAAQQQVIAPLLRRLRDLDTSEEAFQEVCFKALKAWPRHGPPRNAAAWLIMVATHATIGTARQQQRTAPLPPADQISDPGDAEANVAERIDEGDYRNDILRVLVISYHPNRAVAVSKARGPTGNQVARAAFGRAISLASTPAEAAHMRRQIDMLEHLPGVGAQEAP